MDKFNFILQGFGLQDVKAKFYRPGTPLKSGHTDLDAATKKEISDIDANMTTSANGQPLTSMLGTPVFCDLVLETNDRGLRLQLLWVLCEVNQSKNIVKTAVQGRDGTVKEYISKGDYQVSIRGGITSEFSHGYPADEVQDVITLLESNKSLHVTSEYLKLFKIYELVIEDFSFPQKAGVQNIQLFDVKAVSDEPIQLKKK